MAIFNSQPLVIMSEAKHPCHSPSFFMPFNLLEAWPILGGGQDPGVLQIASLCGAPKTVTVRSCQDLTLAETGDL